eukprot:12902898-Prorocentrum_lima.AAC.1
MVQEGRSKHDGVLTKHGYRVFSSGSLHGQLGTQLWVHPDVAPYVLFHSFPSPRLSLADLQLTYRK